MNFISVTYPFFLLVVVLLYWSLRENWLKLLLLTIASLLFYATLQPQYVPLLFVMVLINFKLGQILSAPPDWTIEDWQFAQQDWGQKRRVVLGFGIVLNILLLLGFKYIPFGLETIGLGANIPVLQDHAQWLRGNLIVPLGISFFCFESIAYLVDVYRGSPATQHWLQFAAYKLFFTKLMSGPITGYHAFMAQMKNQKPPQIFQVTEGVWLMVSGAAKKALLADNLGVYVNLCFDNLQRAGSFDLWLATLAYGLQLYLDFSGYVDIVRGSALLLGFNLPENFNYPYFTTSIADFWRRWHITLGDWLRNYLYFPLGGSRVGLARTCVNLTIVMVIAGIWHGAAWGFVLWGALHGLALVCHRLTDALSKKLSWLKAFWQILPGVLLSWFLTQLMVFLAWIFFRLPNLNESFWAVQHLWGHAGDSQFVQKVYRETLGLEPLQMAAILGAIVGLMLLSYTFSRGLKLQLNQPLKIFLIPLGILLVALLMPENATPYIYFEF